jgi:hypothetical protein
MTETKSSENKVTETETEEKGGIFMKNNGFVKEYVIGRKDQFDLDYSIFRKGIEETETREDMINYIEEKMQYVISRVASERAKTLMEEMDLI